MMQCLLVQRFALRLQEKICATSLKISFFLSLETLEEWDRNNFLVSPIYCYLFFTAEAREKL